MLQLYELGKDVDLMGIVCSPEELSEFLVFPSGADVSAIASQLCAIDISMTQDITDTLLKQLDVSAIISLVGR
jgi:hypothetical protein